MVIMLEYSSLVHKILTFTSGAKKKKKSQIYKVDCMQYYFKICRDINIRICGGNAVILGGVPPLSPKGSLRLQKGSADNSMVTKNKLSTKYVSMKLKMKKKSYFCHFI